MTQENNKTGWDLIEAVHLNSIEKKESYYGLIRSINIKPKHAQN